MSKVMVMQSIKGKMQVMDILAIGKTDAELIPYNNRVTGVSDPMVRYSEGHFVHASTVSRMGGVIVDAETLEPVTS